MVSSPSIDPEYPGWKTPLVDRIMLSPFRPAHRVRQLPFPPKSSGTVRIDETDEMLPDRDILSVPLYASGVPGPELMFAKYDRQWSVVRQLMCS